MISAQDAFNTATAKSMPVKIEKAMASLNISIQHNMNLANFSIRIATQDNSTSNYDRKVLAECLPLLRAEGYKCYFDIDHQTIYFNVFWEIGKPKPCPLMVNLEMLHARQIHAEKDLEGDAIHVIWHQNTRDFVKMCIDKFKRGAVSYTIHNIQSAIAIHGLAISFINVGYTASIIGTKDLLIREK